MHIEDHIDAIEKNHDSRFRNLEILTNSLSNDRASQKEIIERLSKRLESTEAQIRKLFALNDEINSKKYERLNGEEIKENFIPPFELARPKSVEHPTIGTCGCLQIRCNQCGTMESQDITTGTRRLRIDNGNIIEIVYEFKCYCCSQLIIIKF